MDHLSQYVRSGHKTVQGWLKPESARLIAELGRLQHEQGIRGASVEIGVHHGRLFILLHLAGSQQKDMAIDIFDDQHLNPENSGHADREMFLANITKHGGDPGRVELLQKSSLEVSAKDITDRVGPAALFSVDGGHTQECAFHDLMLADNALQDDGVVILDDYFNPAWPEVSLGANQYFLDSRSRLRPFAVAREKLYLCMPTRNDFYREHLRHRLKPGDYSKTATMFGLPVDIFWIHPRVHKGWWGAFIQSTAGRSAKRLLRMLGR